MTIDTLDDSQKDPETLENEINQTRSEMNQTLDALERKLSPGQLLDQCLNVFGKHGGELAQNLGNSVKQNPMPVALTALGIVWMMFSSARSSSVSTHEHSSISDASDASAPSIGSRTTDTLKDTAETIKNKTAAVRDKLSSSKESIKNTVNDTSSKAAYAAQVQVRRAREGFNSLLEEQPLILGALGIALGAAIGAALPPTEQEDRLLGGVRDQTVSKVTELTSETYDQVRETVKQAGEAVQPDAEQPPPESHPTFS